MKLSNKKYPYYDHIKLNSLNDLITINYKKSPNEIAFSFKENEVLIKKSYKEFYFDVKRLSNYFSDNYKNKHIGIIGENSYNYLVCFFAIILSGNVSVIFDKDYEMSLLVNLMKKTDVKTIYYSKKYCENIKDLKIKSYELENIQEYTKKKNSKLNKTKTDVKKDAVIFFTSGTTGANKAVVLSEENIMSDIYSASSMFKPSGKVVSILPFHHAFGLITSVLKPFYYKKEVFINNSLKDISKDLKQIKPETIFVVPAFLETFHKQILRNVRKKNKEKKLNRYIKLSNQLLKLNIDIRDKIFNNVLNEFGGNLKYIICGGSALNEKYISWFNNFGITILNGYGITECSPVVSVNRNNFVKKGSVGEVVRDVEVKIINSEICVKGNIVMKGYYKDKKATNEVIKDGYFYTGDLGYIDNDNFLFITGRKKNLIILSNGENISPEVIEEELSSDKAVKEIIVYEENNRLIAYIYPEDNYLNDVEYFDNLIYNYNINKSKSHQIAFVKFRDKEFIKNSNKKILRNKMEE